MAFYLVICVVKASAPVVENFVSWVISCSKCCWDDVVVHHQQTEALRIGVKHGSPFNPLISLT